MVKTQEILENDNQFDPNKFSAYMQSYPGDVLNYLLFVDTFSKKLVFSTG